MELTAGMLLAGRFRLVRPLGQGGMSEVWLAEEVGSGAPVALKFVAGQLASPEAVEALRLEADRARRLVHPNILRVHGFYSDGPRSFIAMQAVEGGDIGTLRGAGYRQILHALQPVTDALEYAHRQGVVHRDLKTSNLLTDAAGGCWLADFGVAAALTAAGPSAAVRGGGSAPAMSPQQLDGEPAAISDDVYGFGALLYDLLAGCPLFDPDPTPERIRHEVPVLPATDLTGAALPVSLTRLLAALLQKNASRRPAGMGAVRAAIDEILADEADAAGLIRPRERIRTETAPAIAGAPALQRRQGLPAWVVYAGLAASLVAVLLVVLYLPSVVREQEPAVRKPPAPVAESAPSPAAADPAALQVQRQLFEETLGEFLREEDELKKVGVGTWGGTEWTELRRLAEAGDGASRARDYAQAQLHYREALSHARAMRTRVPAVLAESLQRGEAALTAANQAEAVRQFDVALAIDAGNAAARRGRERAGNLDRVLDLMTRATAAESAGQSSSALQLYREAAALDPAWAPAVAAVNRLGQAAARDAYQAQMARGYAAMAAGDLAAARAAFENAARQRPGDADARTALSQLDSEQRLGRLSALQAEARTREAQEQWDGAVKSHEAALAMDANLLAAQEGLARSRARADLDAQLRKTLASADRLNDDAAMRDARSLLERAQQINPPGPVLNGQIRDLARLLEVASKPVQVTFESDNLTEVVIYKVGRLGAFTTKALQLRPGAYVAVGSRQGYRDVRRNFRVAPEGENAPVVIRCEEPI
jgi:tetratricopeptide (TPR) repeat protein